MVNYLIVELLKMGTWMAKERKSTKMALGGNMLEVSKKDKRKVMVYCMIITEWFSMRVCGKQIKF